jgi:hypothetical protein
VGGRANSEVEGEGNIAEETFDFGKRKRKGKKEKGERKKIRREQK